MDAAAQARRSRRRRVGRRRPPQLGEVRSYNNDEAKAAPPDTWTQTAPGGTLPPTRRRRATSSAGRRLPGPHAEGHQPRQGAVPWTRRWGAADEARPGPLPRAGGAVDAPVPRGPAAEHEPLPDGVDKKGFWSKAHPSHAPDWLSRWHYDDHGKGETEWYTVADSPPALAWLGNYGALELHPWTSTCDAPRADVGLHRHRPRPQEPVGRRGPARGSLPRRARPPGGAGRAEGDGEARHPDLGAGGEGVLVRRHPGLGGGHLPGDRVDRAGAGQLGVDEVRPRREGPPLRLHAERHQQDAGRPVQRPSGPAPVSVPIEWDELDDPDLAPDRWTIRTVLDRLDEAGDPLHDLVGLQQKLAELA